MTHKPHASGEEILWLLALNVGVCCTNIAAVIAEFKRRPADASAEDLDVRVAEAFRADAQAQMSAMASSVAESLKEPGTVCHRSASMLSCGGRVPFRYPYAPKRGVSRKALAKFGCEDGKVRATPEARRIVAESGAQLDSFQDAQTFLKENLRLDVSVSTMMAITRECTGGTRTRLASHS